jgi:aspartyl-tRNA(Asn)/glutamyl-tRNA(Gln) amidotransferase subunit A
VIDPRGATAVAIADGVRAGKLRARDVIDAYLERIAARDGRLGCYLLVDAEGARRRADAVDAAVKAGRDPGPLAGVPVGVKDIFCTRGIETTCASKILRGFVPPYESTVTARLAEAGAVATGKLNMDEFAMGSSNENSSRGPVKNPWSLAHVPGGSSGGSAAAVAASLCAGATGTDTGGSIRQPAALCGVVGMKPTYGRVSRYGVIAFASSLDHPGPFGRTVEDAAALLEVMAGPDPLDATCIPEPVGAYRQAARRGREGLAGVRLGVPDEYFQPGMDPEVEVAVRAALDELGRAGAAIVPVSLPHTKYAIATYYLICTAEASSNLARYDGVRYGHRAAGARSLEELYTRTRGEGFGPEPKRRIMLGTYVLRAGYYEAYYGKALRARRRLAEDFAAAFRACDAIVTPTSPVPAFKFGERTSDPLQMYLADVLTVAPDLAGIPAISQPCGFSVPGCPSACRLSGRRSARRSASASRAPTKRAPSGTRAVRRRPHDVRDGDRARGAHAAGDAVEDLLVVTRGVRRRAEHGHGSCVAGPAGHAAGTEPRGRRLGGAPGAGSRLPDPHALPLRA